MNVVTGGLGFIGNELVRQLFLAGRPVAILDNRNRVAPHIEDLKNVPIKEVDIVDYNAVLRTFKEVRPKAVFHMAAIHYIPECNENPERTMRINVEGTQAVLRAAAEAGVQKVIFASSGAVYADSSDLLVEDSPIAPVDVYGYTKMFGEQLCLLNHQQSGLPIIIARLFNNVGPRETNPHIIPEIISQIKKVNQLSLGKITTIRDYIHTADCAKALIKLADQHESGIQTVNVATGQGHTVLELIELIKKITKRKIEVQHDSSRIRKFDKQTQVADVSRLIQLTGWRPEIKIEKALTDLLRFEGMIS